MMRRHEYEVNMPSMSTSRSRSAMVAGCYPAAALRTGVSREFIDLLLCTSTAILVLVEL